MKFKSFRLKTQLQIPLILGALFLSSLFFFYSNYRQREIFKQGFLENTENVYETVRLGLEVGLEEENFEAIQRVFDWSKKNPNLAWIVISDAHGDIFATYPSDFNKKYNDLIQMYQKRSLASDIYIAKGEWNSKVDRGSILIGFSTKALLDHQRTIARDAMIAALFLLAFVILLALLISIVITKPLENLERTTVEIADGNIDTIVEISSANYEVYNVTKSFNVMMEKLRDSQEILEEEREKSEKLLLNILPLEISNRLKSGEETIADYFENTTVLFADIVGFTPLSEKLSPKELVTLLNNIFERFDTLTTDFGVEKIKTIGDSYMAASGVPVPDKYHARVMCEVAINMIHIIQDISRESGHKLQVRIGMHSGNLMAGILGKHKFVYDVWGDSVNIASRMESHGEVGKVVVSQATYDLVKDTYDFVDRGYMEIKGKGKMRSFYVSCSERA